MSRVSAAGSVAFTVALLSAYLAFDSQLALAQSADSLLDVVSALALALAVAFAATPSDENHPLGHTSAEPLAALGVAVLAGVLAVQVADRAVGALWSGGAMRSDPWLLAAFAGKGAFRLALWRWVHASGLRGRSPAAAALWVDARNDVLLSGAAVAGYFAVSLGFAGADAWLALPVAAWIGWSGIELGRDNANLLMGAAPAPARARELAVLAEQVPGVLGVHAPRMHFLGTRLQVHLHIEVDPDLRIKEAHDIGDAVRLAIEAEQDVGHCHVHIDITQNE